MTEFTTTIDTIAPRVRAPLYKFSSAADAKAILKSRSIWTKSPLDFNDPFEVLPAFDEERKNAAVVSHKTFYQQIGLPGGGDLIADGGEENIPVESFVDLAPTYHDPFFAKVYSRFRVLCFSEAIDPILLWSHYAASHSGIAIGFDLRREAFPLGRITCGIKVNYITDRSALKLPLDYYQFKGPELTDPAPPPRGYTKTVSGIIISKADEQARYLGCLPTLLAHKYEVWHYEAERRFLYDLDFPCQDGLQDSKPDGNGTVHKTASFTPESVVQIVFGYKCRVADINSMASLLETLPNVKLAYVDLHPTEFKVRIYTGDVTQILATHEARERMSFRSRMHCRI